MSTGIDYHDDIMTKQTTVLINILLLLLVIVSGVVAVYHHRLPSPSYPNNSASLEPAIIDSTAKADIISAAVANKPTISEEHGQKTATEASRSPESKDLTTAMTLPDADIRKMQPASHPFAKEAAKILNGKLEEGDSINRRKILNYCEHFRTAYTTKDIDFIRQVLCEDALIIVGHTVRPAKESNRISASTSVKYSIRSKQEYIRNLTAVFAANKKINVDFSDFKIMRHPTMEGIYGVTLRQKYESDLYSDEGYLFLLWDFRNPSMPMIHVRTWQPGGNISDEDDLIGISDFNLQ